MAYSARQDPPEPTPTPRSVARTGQTGTAAPQRGLTTEDMQVTVETTNRLGGRGKGAIGTLTFGDGAKTYPTGGIPLPGPEVFGFSQRLEVLQIAGHTGDVNDYTYSYNRGTNTLQCYLNNVEIANTVMPATRTLVWIAWGT